MIYTSLNHITVENFKFHIMKLFVLIPIILISLSIYFVFTLDVLPEKYLNKKQLEPSPYFETQLSNSQIKLGDSFTVQINSENVGDYGDIYIISVAFPTIEKIDDIVRITHYDLSHSPLMIDVGSELGANYTGGVQTIFAKYPSIEAMNRPVPANSNFNMDLLITPKETGIFEVYVKNIVIPHTSDIAHYPREGLLDHQNEYVQKLTIQVNP